MAGEVMIYHYCPVEKAHMGIEAGQECNWCGKVETDLNKDSKNGPEQNNSK